MQTEYSASGGVFDFYQEISSCKPNVLPLPDICMRQTEYSCHTICCLMAGSSHSSRLARILRHCSRASARSCSAWHQIGNMPGGLHCPAHRVCSSLGRCMPGKHIHECAAIFNGCVEARTPALSGRLYRTMVTKKMKSLFGPGGKGGVDMLFAGGRDNWGPLRQNSFSQARLVG